MNTAKTIAICQGCLAVHQGTPEQIQAFHQEDVFCHCGEQVCACEGCAASAARLLAGERDPAKVGGLAPGVDLTGWTPEKGVA